METKEIEMRLNNLEEKMNEVHKLSQILPRLEERMINQKDDLSDHERRLRTLEQQQQKNTVYVGWIERVAWALIAAAVATLALFFR
jgi:uncharacterized membrane protein YjjP (DUF1212 family)|tara:strand:- start:464 stop:721 length:258 start_codon:yes stop_codon:yes gene_type:complete